MTLYIDEEVESNFDFSVRETAGLVCEAVLEAEGCPYEVQVSLLLTDNQGIRELNREARGIDRDTDVLSFPNVDFERQGVFEMDENREADYFDPDTGELILGDIMISADKVREQAENYGHSEKREFAFLIAHSMLHLCGYDHIKDKEAELMEHKQEEVLRKLNITRD